MPDAPQLVVDLNAVVLAVTDDQPRLLTVAPGAFPAVGDALRALPFGPFDLERDRTLERCIRETVTRQTGGNLGTKQIGAFGQNETALEAPGVTCSRPKFLSQVFRHPTLREIDKHDARAFGRGIRGLPERRQMGRIEVCVRDGQRSDVLLPERSRDLDDEVGHDGSVHADRARKVIGEVGRSVPDRGKNQSHMPGPRDLFGTDTSHPLGDQHVGSQGQVRSMRFDCTHRKDRNGRRTIEVAHFFPGELSEVMYGHADRGWGSD